MTTATPLSAPAATSAPTPAAALAATLRPVPLTVLPAAAPADRTTGHGPSLSAATGVDLPLIAVTLDAQVISSRASICVTQRYINPTDEPLEVVYRFPLPPRAAVASMRATIAGRSVDAVLRERESARRQYATAVASGVAAALVEEEHPSTFTASLGNVPPRSEARIELRLDTLVDVDVDASGHVAVQFRFPTLVAPRYGDTPPVTDGFALPAPTLDWSVRILPPAPLTSVASTAEGTYEVSDASNPTVRTTGSVAADRDVVVAWSYRAPHEPTATIVADRDVPGSASNRRSVPGNASVSVALHAVSSPSTRSREVVVVLDRSGSMDGWKMRAAGSFVEQLLSTLTPRDTIAVAAFDHTLEPLSTTPVPAVPAEVDRLIGAVRDLDARGGTEAASALRWAARQFTHTPGTDAYLVIVTDGHVAGEDACVRALGPGVRIVAVGIDAAANLGLLTRLADLTDGAAVCASDPAEVRATLDAALKRLAPPALDNVVVELVSPSGKRTAVALHGPQVVFDGSLTTLTGRCAMPRSPKATLHVTATDATGSIVEFDVPLRPGPSSDACFWARRRVRELEDAWVAGGVGAPSEQEIVDVSLGFSTLSRFTAFVAVDEMERPVSVVPPRPAVVAHAAVSRRSVGGVLGGVVMGAVPGGASTLSYNASAASSAVSATGSLTVNASPPASTGTWMSSVSSFTPPLATSVSTGAPSKRNEVGLDLSVAAADEQSFAALLGEFVASLVAGVYDWGAHVDLVLASSSSAGEDSRSVSWRELVDSIAALRQDPSTWPAFIVVAHGWLNSRRGS